MYNKSTMKVKPKLIILTSVTTLIVGGMASGIYFVMNPTSNSPEINHSSKQQMYGLDYMNELNPYTKHKQTNQAIDLEAIVNPTTSNLRDSLTNSNVNQLFQQWSQWYINRYSNDRQSTCNGTIKEFNIRLNSDKTISGNIRLEFKWNQDMYSSIVPTKRFKGDIEIHNFIFDNNPLSTYINTSFTNYLSIKIPSHIYQLQLIKADGSQGFNVGFKNYNVVLDGVKGACLDINNSLCSINLQEYVQHHMYIYQKVDSNTKALIDEIIKSLGSFDYDVIVAGDNPYNHPSLLPPLLKIKLSKNYSIKDSDNLEIIDELSCLHYAISNGSRIIIKDNYAYIKCWDAAFKRYLKNTLIDMNSPSQSLYGEDTFVLFNPMDLYNDKLQSIKNKAINAAKNELHQEWFTTLNSLDDTNKAKLIYKLLLPQVSYGGMSDAAAGNLLGYVSGKVICDGYAHIFSYLANILNISSLYITGQVKTNADPSNPSEPGMHAWNLIRNNDTWLWCDPTWDDSINANSPSYKFDNFLKTSNQFMTPTTHLNVTNWNSGSDIPIKY